MLLFQCPMKGARWKAVLNKVLGKSLPCLWSFSLLEPCLAPETEKIRNLGMVLLLWKLKLSLVSLNLPSLIRTVRSKMFMENQ